MSRPGDKAEALRARLEAQDLQRQSDSLQAIQRFRTSIDIESHPPPNAIRFPPPSIGTLPERPSIRAQINKPGGRIGAIVALLVGLGAAAKAVADALGK